MITEFANIFREFGTWGIVIVVAVVVLLRGEFSFKYPRRSNKER